VPPAACAATARPAARAASARHGTGRWQLLAVLLALVAPPTLRAGPLADQVRTIEARDGSQPAQVIAALQPLEAQARAGDADDLRTFLAAWGYAHLEVDKPSVVDAAIEELTNLGMRSGDAATLAFAYTLKASKFEYAGQMRSAFGWIETALPFSRAAASPDLHYWVDSVAADLASANGQLDEAMRLFEQAALDAQATRNLRREAQSCLALAPLHIVKREYAQALRYAERARALATQADRPSLIVASWVTQALVDDARGDGAAARRDLSAAEAAQRAMPAAASSPLTPNPQAGADGWLGNELDGLLNLAELYLDAGNPAQARTLALRAQARARARHDRQNEGLALVNLGLAELGIGQTAAGMRDADAGLALMGTQRNAELLMQLNRYVSALERHGQPRESWKRLREALLLEIELSRHDRESTVLALQRESSLLQRQRQMEQLQHENALQAAEIANRSTERTLSWLLAAAMALGGIVAWRLYLRTRESNRELARTNETLAFASLHDTVTGLFNRRAMEADIKAYDQVAISIVSLSLKQFGLIVGHVGHDLGDVLLCRIATRLEAAAAPFGARLYRVDGVNFSAIFRCTGDEARLREAAQALMSAMDAPFEIGNQDLIVHVGVGMACHPGDAPTPQEAARLAELAKLQAFAEPGNTCVSYSAAIGEGQRDKLQMEARLLKALAQGGFELYYQGQRRFDDARFIGFEALLRWHDGERMVSPAEFIPVAEETGLIVKIGAWVLRQACLQARAWAEAGLGKPLVAVNISPRQFAHPDFLATVRETLRETGVDPAQIELEITESSVMNDAEASVMQLHALRQMGLQLAIDDFGTGYASLSYLRRFPLDTLKIDRSFIMRLGASAGDDTIVRSVIELAHGLGLSVTAEGVETEAQQALLQAWGCDLVQGFLHSRPGPAGGAGELLKRQQARQPATAQLTVPAGAAANAPPRTPPLALRGA
jgi:diguanylate cyclase (GGDEF)-like protein